MGGVFGQALNSTHLFSSDVPLFGISSERSYLVFLNSTHLFSSDVPLFGISSESSYLVFLNSTHLFSSDVPLFGIPSRIPCVLEQYTPI